MNYPLVMLGDITSLQAGYGFPIDLQGKKSGRYPFAKVGDISRGGRSGSSILSIADNYIDVEDLVKIKAKPIPSGSVLFAKIGEAIRQNHRVVAGCDMLIDNNAMAAIPSERIDTRFLYHFLKTVDFYTLAPATTVPALRKSELEKIKTPLPPLPEQRRIAAILDQADALRAKRREALAQLDSLTQSIFIEMFGDPVTNPKGWLISKVGDLLASASYGTSEKSSATGQFPVLRMNNITRTGEMDFTDLKYMDLDESEYERYLVKAGDVLFNRTNSAELVGKTAVFRQAKSMAYAGYLIRLRTNAANDPEYLAAFMNTPYMKRILRGMCKSIIGMANINATEVKSIKIAQPPLALQVQFRERIEAINQIKAIHRAALNEESALFASLQHRAFRGEL